MATFLIKPLYSDKFIEALQYAAEIHKFQVRKNNTPYIAHLLQVAGLVIEVGGDEDEAIAALLHDAIEDAGVTHQEIAQRFNKSIANIVNMLSEPKGASVAQRKAAYVAQVSSSTSSVKLVSAADKLHNLRGYEQHPELWNEHVADFYRQLLPLYNRCPSIPRHWVGEMNSLMEELED